MQTSFWRLWHRGTTLSPTRHLASRTPEETRMLRAFRLVFVLLVVTVVAGVPRTLAAEVATPAAQAATPVAGVANGSLLVAMDTSIPPGQDFYRYATGRWQDAATIPTDRAGYGISDELNDLTIEQLLGLLNRLST